MPLDLQPVLDLEPIEGSTSEPSYERPPERPDYIEAAAQPAQTHDESGLPINMSPEQRRQLETASEMAAAQREGEPAQRAAGFFKMAETPIIPPETFLASPERRAAELSPTERGVTSAVAETASGLTSPQNLALLSLGPIGRIAGKVAGGLFGYEMAKEQPELARQAGELSVTGTPEEQAKANARLGINTVLGGLTLAAPFLDIKPTGPKMPEEIRSKLKEISAADVEASGALPKATEAAVEAVVTTPKEAESAVQEQSSNAGVLRAEQPEVGLPQVGARDTQPEIPSQQVTPAQTEGRAEAPQAEVLLKGTPVEQADKIAALTPQEFFDATRTGELKGGFTGKAVELGKQVTTPEEITRLKEHEAAAVEETNRAMAAQDPETMASAAAKKQFFTEAIESAVGVSENKSNLTKEQVAKAKQAGIPARSKPAPVDTSGVAGVPENVPAAEPVRTRDWDSFYEDLIGNLDSFSPARHTGKRNYSLDEVAQRFVEFAQKKPHGTPLSELAMEFSKVDEAAPSQLKKLKAAVKDLEQRESARVPEATPPEMPAGPAAEPAAGTNAGDVTSTPALPEKGLSPARAGEVGMTPPTGQEPFGIAARVREARKESGVTGPVEPGQGIAAADSVARGQELLKSGADPQAALERFNATKSINAEDIALVRAHGEQLAREANAAADKFGVNSPEYEAAWEKGYAWDKATKPMQTEWHKAGQAQQGETDVDTGSFHGLRRAYNEDTGKDFTPEQSKEAERISKKVRVATAETDAATQKLYEQLNLELGPVDSAAPVDFRAVKMLLADYKPGSKFTTQQSKTIWDAARKAYIDQGVTDFNDIRNGLATDLGLSVKDVTRALGQSGKAKVLTNELWKKQQVARQLKSQAKAWLKSTALPGWRRAIESVPKILFGLKVGFHGTVALGTHAPFVAFQPRFWKTYVTDFGKMYKMVGSPAYYEMQMQDLQRRPNYITARRAGLVNDPFTYEDFNSPDTAKYFGKLTGMGNRGYSVLKVLRQDMFDQYWNQLPRTAQMPEVAAAISDGVNHATGVVKGRAPSGANLALFAPRLEASRVAWLAVDPVKALATAADWRNATPAEKVFAINQIKEKAWVAGTLFGLLALNQGFLKSVGSKQEVNLTDPMKSDFLKFKAAGMTFSYGNAMISMARLPVRLYQIRQSDGGKLKNLVHPDESSYTVLGEYARSQLSPFASLASSLWFKSDWQNRPLPNSERAVPKRLREQGIDPYTWNEFWTEQMLPIPLEEAAREVWVNGMGMTPSQAAHMRKAMATIAVMGATGGRLTEDPEVQ